MRPWISAWIAAVAMMVDAAAQSAPAPQALPYFQDFGTAAFSSVPAGIAAWNGLNGGSVETQAKAESSAPSGNATIAAVTAPQTGGGCYGYATGGNARFYIQTSGTSPNGVNQLASAVNTTGWSAVTLEYDIEIISAQPRTIGVICQYRLGNSGSWTSLTPAMGNPFSQAGGNTGLKATVSVQLPPAALDQPNVQIRWALWRGTESGASSSGLAIDNIAVSGLRDFSPPPGYYTAAEGLTGTSLKEALQTISANNHTPLAYSATFNPLRAIHEDPNNSNNVITVYSGTSLGKFDVYFPGGGLNSDQAWDREHLWPVSYGLNPNGSEGPAYSDLFNLRPAISSVNSQRGNLYFDNSSGTISVPPLAPLCSYDNNSWQPRDSEKGDLARVMFYMATRYDGSEPGTIGLELANSPSSPASTGRFANLSTMLSWHEEDPVTEGERRIHQLIVNQQGNRNPFVDRPDFVAQVWGTPNNPLIAPAPLPLVFGGPWSPLPNVGFLGEGLGTYESNLGGDNAGGSARFDDANDRLTIAFDSSPAILSYHLKANTSGPSVPSEGVFRILQSSDGGSFTLVREVINKNTADESFSDILDPASRFVRFLYQQNTSGNIQLDKLGINSLPEFTPWRSWQAFYELSGSDAAPGADPDADGYDNLAEYALGRSPVTADAAQLAPVFEKTPGKLRITAVLRILDPALASNAETTADLTDPASWTGVGVTRIVSTDQSGVPDGFERTVFEIEDDGTPRRFARLRFTLSGE